MKKNKQKIIAIVALLLVVAMVVTMVAGQMLAYS
jgi:hypothetical protein